MNITCNDTNSNNLVTCHSNKINLLMTVLVETFVKINFDMRDINMCAYEKMSMVLKASLNDFLFHSNVRILIGLFKKTTFKTGIERQNQYKRRLEPP